MPNRRASFLGKTRPAVDLPAASPGKPFPEVDLPGLDAMGHRFATDAPVATVGKRFPDVDLPRLDATGHRFATDAARLEVDVARFAQLLGAVRQANIRDSKLRTATWYATSLW